jgi:hypothetical protein
VTEKPQLGPRFMVCVYRLTELQGTHPAHALESTLYVHSYVYLGYPYHESGKGSGNDHIMCPYSVLIQRGVSNEWKASRDISVAIETCFGRHHSRKSPGITPLCRNWGWAPKPIVNIISQPKNNSGWYDYAECFEKQTCTNRRKDLRYMKHAECKALRNIV